MSNHSSLQALIEDISQDGKKAIEIAKNKILGRMSSITKCLNLSIDESWKKMGTNSSRICPSPILFKFGSLILGKDECSAK